MKTRILAIIQHFEAGNKSRFGLKIGAKSGLVGNWVAGRSRPGADYRAKICKIYGISRNWLDTGEGTMLEATKQPETALEDNQIVELRKSLSEAQIELAEARGGLRRRNAQTMCILTAWWPLCRSVRSIRGDFGWALMILVPIPYPKSDV